MPFWFGLAYLFSVGLAVADPFCCSLICVLVVAAAQRAKHMDTNGRQSPKDVEIIATLSMQSPEDVMQKWETGVPFHVQIVRAMTNKWHPPLGLGLSLFPVGC